MFITNELNNHQAKEHLFSGRSDLHSTLSLDGCSQPALSGSGRERFREIERFPDGSTTKTATDPGNPLLDLDQPGHLFGEAHNPSVNSASFPRINGVRSVRTVLITKGFQNTL
jgi:hypothetical protein